VSISSSFVFHRKDALPQSPGDITQAVAENDARKGLGPRCIDYLDTSRDHNQELNDENDHDSPAADSVDSGEPSDVCVEGEEDLSA
jgi:hypothetical protein